MANLSLVFELIGKDSSATKSFRDVGDAADDAGRRGEGFGSSLSSGLKLAAGAFLASGIVAGFKGLYDAAAESAKIGALTEQVIKSTGGAAKLSADQVGDLVTAISNKTGVDDEAIQSGANLLLTFTNIKNQAGAGNDIFTQTTQIMTDMSAALGTDASASATQLGKALNDPIKGVSALSKVGVQFTADQKEQIKTLVESGDVMGAQKVILGELSTQFGGAAEAAATPVDKLKVNIGNLQEAVGGALIPAFNGFATFATGTLIPAFSEIGGYAKQFFDILFRGDFNGGPLQEDSGIVDTLFDIREALVEVGGIAKQAFDILFRGDFNGGPLQEDSQAVDILFRIRETLVEVGGVAKQAFDILFRGDFSGGPLAEDSTAVTALFSLRDAFISLAGFLTATVIPALGSVAQFILQNQQPIIIIAGLIAALYIPGWIALGVASVVNSIKAAASWVVTQAAAIAAGVVHSAQVIGMVAGWVLMGAQSLLGAAKVAAAWLIAMGPIGLVIAAVVGVVALVVANWDTVKNATKTAWDAVVGAVSGAFEAVKSAVSTALEFVKNLFLNFTGPGLIIKHWDTIKEKTREAWEAVKSAVSGAWTSVTTAVTEGIGSAVSLVTGLPGKIVSALGNLGSTLYQKGKDLINGLLNGAGSILKDIGKFFLDKVPSFIRGPFESALGIASPSKVFAGYGVNIGEGLVSGMAGMRTAVASEMAALADTSALTSLGSLSLGVGEGAGLDLSAARPAGGDTFNTTINAVPNVPTEDQLDTLMRRSTLLAGRRR